MCKYIAIAGNIGSGKTSLVGMLSHHLKWSAYYERNDENPYLYDFYHNMRRWSFNLQIYFLVHRGIHLKQMLSTQKHFIQDRTIYEDFEIFARNLFQNDLMESRDWHTYQMLYQEYVMQLPKPHLLIYLKASPRTLIEHIEQRGREYEKNIRPDYIKALNDLYDAWYDAYSYGKLSIDIDNIDFVHIKKDHTYILDQIRLKLPSLI